MLQEAARQFYLQGYKATTMRSLASAVGIKHPSLFSLFENKSAIAAVIMAKYYQGVQEAAEALVREDPGGLAEKDAVLLAFHAINFGLLYEDKHIAEFFTSFYEEDSEGVDAVIASLGHFEEEETGWSEEENTVYQLDLKVLGMTSMMLTRELGEKTILPEFASLYFVRKLILVRRSSWSVTEEGAERFYRTHWEKIRETVRKIDVYRDYISL